MKKKLGVEQAKKLINFRLMHLQEMKTVAAAEEIIKQCQCREVESLDVYFDPVVYDAAKESLLAWKADMPEEARDYYYFDRDEANEASASLVRICYPDTD